MLQISFHTCWGFQHSKGATSMGFPLPSPTSKHRSERPGSLSDPTFVLFDFAVRPAQDQSSVHPNSVHTRNWPHGVFETWYDTEFNQFSINPSFETGPHPCDFWVYPPCRNYYTRQNRMGSSGARGERRYESAELKTGMFRRVFCGPGLQERCITPGQEINSKTITECEWKCNF